jgi:hypothetical protein
LAKNNVGLKLQEFPEIDTSDLGEAKKKCLSGDKTKPRNNPPTSKSNRVN